MRAKRNAMLATICTWTGPWSENPSRSIAFTLITSFKLMNFFRQASDLDALEMIIEKNGQVKNAQKLHAKMYIFDDKKSVITSGNLTNGGLRQNYEYGIYSEDAYLLESISGDFDELNNDSQTGIISKEEINTAKKILESVPKEKSLRLPAVTPKLQGEIDDVYTGGEESIIKNLDGWKLDVFKCLLNIPQQIFQLKDVYLFESKLMRLHPINTKVKPKIRQQLQQLRDIGLIQFLGQGHYRKLWK